MSGIATPEGFFSFGLAGALATGLVAAPIHVAPFDMEIVDTVLWIGTAPTGAAAIFNLQVTRALDASTANLYSTAARPQVAAGKNSNTAEQTETFPAGSWPTPGPYALNDPQPGGSVAVAPAYVGGTSVLPIAAPDLNTILLAGDLLQINVIQVGSTVAGSNAVAAVHWLKR